jgi:hypothetical protein
MRAAIVMFNKIASDERTTSQRPFQMETAQPAPQQHKNDLCDDECRPKLSQQLRVQSIETTPSNEGCAGGIVHL